MTLRRIEQGNRKRYRAVHRAHAAERQSESDDVVRSNIPPDYQALWERVKRGIHLSINGLAAGLRNSG